MRISKCLMMAAIVFAGSGMALSASYVVLGYNDLGMHCMNQDFSEFMILPPYNVMHAMVIQRGGEPRIIKSGVTVSYSVPGNTYSAGKTNFWDYAQALLGLNLPPNIGLTGNSLSGTMVPTDFTSGRNDWEVTGIPITPIEDNGTLNAYQLAQISVTQNGTQLASTQAVIPVSWEISCELCHNTPGISVATDILQKHDQLHPEVNPPLMQQRPVFCGKCHAQPPLNAPGQPGVPTLSSAMHTSHAPRMAAISGKLTVECYACHPGVQTQCLRDVHYSNGLTCLNCHTSMEAVGNPARKPWVDEPRCDSCHHVAGHRYEQGNTLYRNSVGHNGVMCEACHGSPHAITPTVVAADNVQAIALMGKPGTIGQPGTCTVCHTSQPDDSFNHTAGEGFRLIGDIVRDGAVNLADLKALVTAWNTVPGSAKWNSNADINRDSTVNIGDLKILVANWGRTL